MPPIAAATRAGHAGMVEYLLEQEADPDRHVRNEIPYTSSANSDIAPITPGERALHLAATTGNIGIVRLLVKRPSLRLKRPSADPTATTNEGCIPLMLMCSNRHVCAEVVRLLLGGGADPALATEEGHIPLQEVARNGHIDLVDMLQSRAPATLNSCSANGQTPLFWACGEGHESMVRFGRFGSVRFGL